jgi:hypothetical protein
MVRQNEIDKSIFFILECQSKVKHDGQGLLQGWNSLPGRPESRSLSELVKDTKVQVNKQKHNNVGPDLLRHNNNQPMLVCPATPAAKHLIAARFIW